MTTTRQNKIVSKFAEANRKNLVLSIIIERTDSGISGSIITNPKNAFEKKEVIRALSAELNRIIRGGKK